MNDLVLASQLDSLVLDSPIARRVYALALGEPHRVVRLEPRPGFTKATVNAWLGALDARGLRSVSIARTTAMRKLAVEAAENGPLAPEI